MSADQQLRALIYNRVSADPTARRISTASQDSENRAFCAREGWIVVDTITDDDHSASRFATKQREGYQRVLAAINGKVYGRIDVLVTWESSRGERKLDGYVELRDRLERNRVLLAYKGRVYDMSQGDDRFATGLDALLDEREAERARERTLRGHRASVENRTPRSFAPYGYVRTYNEHTGRLLGQEPDPETAPVVQGIVRRILAGDTLYSIAKSLDDADVPTPQERLDRWKGRTGVVRAGWSSSMLRNLLSKPSLMGIRTHLGQAVGRGTWEPIVSPEDWRRVQAVLGERRNTGHDTRTKHLLSGIAECGPCGAWMRPLTNRGRATYVCAGTVPTAPKGHVSRGRDQLDAFVVAHVLRVLGDPRFLEASAARRRGADDHAATLAREIADLQAELAQYVASAASRSGVARAAFEQVADQLASQIEAKQHELTSSADVPAAVLGLAGVDVAARWDEAGLEVQRLAVRSLVRVVVHRSSTPGMREFDWRTVEIRPR